jgi:superoxide reductase
MGGLGEQIQTGDWKKEKHTPVIECADQVAAGEVFEVKVSLGKEIAHPNTTEHHISWVSLYFKPDDEKFTYDVGHFEFNAHGQSVAGANEGPVHTVHSVAAWVKTIKSGTLHAVSYCNIHGLWESSKAITVA